MRKDLLIFLLLLLSLNVLKAQKNYNPGFIITMDNDTIPGLIDSRGAMRNALTCSFKKTNEDQSTDYLPIEIQAYGFVDGKYYVSRDIYMGKDTIKVFLEYLINGIVDIYYYRDVNDDYYFIEKENINLTELDNKNKVIQIDGIDYIKSNKNYLGILKYAFNESPEIQKKTESFTLTHNNIIDIARDYHEYVCKGEECIIYEKKKNFMRFKLQPIIAVDFHSIKGYKDKMVLVYGSESNYTNLPEEFYMQSYIDYSFGLIGSISLPLLNENIALSLQAKYGRYKLSGSADVEDNSLTYDKFSLTTSGNMLMSNLYFSYTFPKGMIRPVFLAGFSYGYAISKNDIEMTKHFISGNYISFNTESSDVFATQYMGFVLGAGIDIPIYKKYTVSTILQYNIMQDINEFSCYSYFPLSIIVGFKI